MHLSKPSRRRFLHAAGAAAGSLALPSGLKRANGTPGAMKLYADGTDWTTEFDAIGATFYLTPEVCEKAHSSCIAECGVVEVEVSGEMPAVENGKCRIRPPDDCEEDGWRGNGCRVKFVRWVRGSSFSKGWEAENAAWAAMPVEEKRATLLQSYDCPITARMFEGSRIIDAFGQDMWDRIEARQDEAIASGEWETGFVYTWDDCLKDETCVSRARP